MKASGYVSALNVERITVRALMGLRVGEKAVGCLEELRIVGLSDR